MSEDRRKSKDQKLPLPLRTMERSSPKNGSHGVTLNQSSGKRREKRERITIQSSEVCLTVRIANRSLTRRHLRLMLEVLLYEIVESGISLERYLLLVHLYQNLMGQKSEPLDLAIDHERRLCLLSEIIMLDLSEKTFNALGPIRCLTEDLRNEILDNDLIMNKRTYNSRRGHWCPENWLTVRPVEIDSLIERNGYSSRYSSYTKGYGESHPDAHIKKTKPSVELDGEEAKEPEPIRLSELRQLLTLNRLRLKPKGERMEN
jgi:hypothetical protein